MHPQTKIAPWTAAGDHDPTVTGAWSPLIEQGVCPENLKLFINLTFFDFVLMLEQRTPLSSDMSW